MAAVQSDQNVYLKVCAASEPVIRHRMSISPPTLTSSRPCTPHVELTHSFNPSRRNLIRWVEAKRGRTLARLQAPSTAKAANTQARSTTDTTPAILRLSAELRNHIYDFALVQASPIVLYGTCGGNSDGIPCRHEVRRNVAQPPLLRVCCQIRNEALAIFYGGNVFQSSRLDPVAAWLRSIGHGNRMLVRQIRGFAVETPWLSVAKAKGRAQSFEDYMEKDRETPLQAGVVKAPCEMAEEAGNGMLLWVDRYGDVVVAPAARVGSIVC